MTKQRRGLGIGRESIFSKTVVKETPKNVAQPKVKKVQSVTKPKKTVEEPSQVVSFRLKPEHNQLIDDIAHWNRKKKQDVLAEIIAFYRENATYELPRKI